MLMLLATVGEIHAKPNNRAQIHYLNGIKLLQQKGDAASRHVKANIWFTMAAADGHSGALFHLGVSYQTGRGIEKNLQLAAHFYQLAAARYHVAAKYNLAVIHAHGKGAERDLEKAFGLILIAKQRSGAHPKIKQRLDAFQASIEDILSDSQIHLARWQVEQLFGTGL
jgi:TPR repeat protein